MAFDPAVGEQLLTLAITATQQSLALTHMSDRNLTQGLGVVNSSLIHQNGAVSDDSGLIAALQTAAGAPRQGGHGTDFPPRTA